MQDWDVGKFNDDGLWNQRKVLTMRWEPHISHEESGSSIGKRWNVLLSASFWKRRHHLDFGDHRSTMDLHLSVPLSSSEIIEPQFFFCLKIEMYFRAPPPHSYLAALITLIFAWVMWWGPHKFLQKYSHQWRTSHYPVTNSVTRSTQTRAN